MIFAVVVTYNRRALLAQSLAQLEKQTRRLDKILVIDNASTDGTDQYLAQWQAQDPTRLQTIRLKTNTGGSGGFTYGIKEAYSQGAEWIWAMDDDSLAAPDCLEKLLGHADRPDLGFLAPVVRWKDGSLCLPNASQAEPMHWGDDYAPGKPLVRILTTTFVGALLNRRAIKDVGLPVPQFFIWYDDIEYTQRITRKLKAYCVLDAEITHLIPANEIPDFSHVTEKTLWKYRYGIRNETAVTSATKRFGPVRAALLWLQRDREMQRGGVSASLRLKVLAWGLKGLFFPYQKFIERV